jgi:branched-chain amino acid transport system ATP-binding protein
MVYHYMVRHQSRQAPPRTTFTDDTILRVLTHLRQDGLAILLVEQNVRAALQVSDYGYVLEMGEVAAEGQASDLARDPHVLETYLGQRRNVTPN